MKKKIRKKNTCERRNGGINGEMKIRGRGKTEKSADDTANKTVESRVYIKVNMKTSNGHYVLITGT